MATLAKPFMHGASAGGTLNVGLWDHWVPGGNEPWKRLAREWGDKNKVDVRLDFITSQGDKLNLTIATEAQAGAGHDILHLSDAQPGAYASRLEPVGESLRPRRAFRQAAGGGAVRGFSGRNLDRGADFAGNDDTAVLRPHRSVAGACRAGRAENVPGRRAAR